MVSPSSVPSSVGALVFKHDKLTASMFKGAENQKAILKVKSAVLEVIVEENGLKINKKFTVIVTGSSVELEDGISEIVNNQELLFKQAAVLPHGVTKSNTKLGILKDDKLKNIFITIHNVEVSEVSQWQVVKDDKSSFEVTTEFYSLDDDDFAKIVKATIFAKDSKSIETAKELKKGIDQRREKWIKEVSPFANEMLKKIGDVYEFTFEDPKSSGKVIVKLKQISERKHLGHPSPVAPPTPRRPVLRDGIDAPEKPPRKNFKEESEIEEPEQVEKPSKKDSGWWKFSSRS